jgi:hypothetical protein
VNGETVVKHLRALWRTDRIIAEIRMRHMLVGLGLRAFAALIAAFGLLMLELSAYFALVQIWTAVSAAAILGACLAEGRPRAASLNSPPKFTAPPSRPCRARPARCNRSSPAWCSIR